MGKESLPATHGYTRRQPGSAELGGSALAAHALRAPAVDDLAEHHELVEGGPNPLVRAVVGIALGLTAGLAAALLTPRDRADARRG